MSKPSYTLGILITTCNENIHRVKKELLPVLIKDNEVDEIVISHQIFDNKTLPKKNLTKGKVKYSYMYDKGLSKNRNNGLKYLTTDLVHICDDDITYLPNFSSIIKSAYKEKKNFDVITFQAIDEKNNFHFNKKEGKHNLFTILKIVSWGITFKKEKIINMSIFFDEHFGIGTKWIAGEETIFLKDCLNKKQKLYHCDIPICFHPAHSSGKVISDERILSYAPILKRIYGFTGIFYPLCKIVFYPITKKRYQNYGYDFFRFSKLCFKSFFITLFKH